MPSGNKPKFIMRNPRAGSMYEIRCPKCGKKTRGWDRSVAGNGSMTCKKCGELISAWNIEPPLGMKGK